MTKVLIVSVPAQDIAKPPAILSILAGCCESINVDYEITDLNLYMYKKLPEQTTTELSNDFVDNQFRSKEYQDTFDKICDHVVDQIYQYKITHVAISVFTYASILATYRLINRIRQAECDCKVIIGGLGLNDAVQSITGNSKFGQYCLENKLVDFCIFGEGDIAFVELLKNNINYPGINRPNAQQITNLDSIPIPSYQKIDPADYYYMNAPEVIVTGSRGCVRDCTFCDVGSYWPKYVFKSGERLAQELFKIWLDKRINRFDFSDSLINGSIKSFRQFNKELIKLKTLNPEFKPEYKGQFICRPQGQLVEQDYIDMKHAGAETLVVGIESFSNDVRNHMRKKFDNNSIDWHFEMCAKYNIKNALLLLAGYVTETLEDHKVTLEYLKKYQIYALSRIIYVVGVTVNGLEIYEGSPLNSMKDELGIVHVPTDGTLQYSAWISTKNPSLTVRERLRRGVEIFHLANSLGYKIADFNQRIDGALKQFQKINSTAGRKIFKIETL
jgi:radical SAM superfamily enzyme YgiQ (UPF0313 family)